MIVLLALLFAHLGKGWHVSIGPWGWWTWIEWHHGVFGFGWNKLEGFVSYFRR